MGSSGVFAATDPTVLYQSITAQEALDLHLVIPSDTLPGYKILEIKVTGMGQESRLRRIAFCKDIDGEIHWNNLCQGLTKYQPQNILAAATRRDQLPTYNPLSEPKKTIGTAVVAFAALTVVTAAGGLVNSTPSSPNTSNNNQQGYLAQVSRGGAMLVGIEAGRGEKRRRRKRSSRLSTFIIKWGERISGPSPLATRILSDGNYLRAGIGNFSLLLYPISAIVGWLATRNLHQQALPPSLLYIFVMMAIGVADALAGVIAATSFAISIIATGHITNLNEVLTVVGVALLAFSPALIAGAFRPLRRVTSDFSSAWERATDYLLASILTGWVIQQIVQGLPGLAGLQLPITVHARVIALVAAGFIVIRFAGEDLALYLYPMRLNSLEPNYLGRNPSQQLLATIFKVTVFGVIAGKFIGINFELFIGIALFALPLILGIFESKFPKSKSIQKWMPTGIIEMLTMTLVGFLLTLAIQARYPSARTYVLMSFLLLSLPGLILKLLILFGEEGAKDWSRVHVVGGRLNPEIAAKLWFMLKLYEEITGEKIIL